MKAILAGVMCWLGILANGVAAHAAVEEPPEIPEIRTMEELKALKPIRLNDWDLRIGLSDGGAAAGPWVLVYCHATFAGKGERPELRPTAGEPEEALGPIAVRLSWDDLERKRSLMVWKNMPAFNEALFCQIIRTDQRGKCRVEVLGPKEEKVLLRKRLEVKEPATSYWQPLAAVRHKEGKRVVTLAQDPPASRPGYDGVTSLLPLHREERQGEREPPPRPAHNELPGAVPPAGRWDALGQLELTAEKDQFVVRSKQVKMLDHPGRHLLARWWINDKPIVPPRRTVGALQQQAEQIVLTEAISIPFGLPPHLGELEAGDRVALQVLYVPAGHEPLSAGVGRVQEIRRNGPARVRGGDTAVVPLASNRLEIQVTKELLEARQAK